jgi:hypothetical protein
MKRTVWAQRAEPVDCAICLRRTKRVFRTPCGHEFHTTCLRRAHDECGRRCPLCRSDIALPQLASLETRVERMEASMAELAAVMARMQNDMQNALLDAMVRAASDAA